MYWESRSILSHLICTYRSRSLRLCSCLCPSRCNISWAATPTYNTTMSSYRYLNNIIVFLYLILVTLIFTIPKHGCYKFYKIFQIRKHIWLQGTVFESENRLGEKVYKRIRGHTVYIGKTHIRNNQVTEKFIYESKEFKEVYYVMLRTACKKQMIYYKTYSSLQRLKFLILYRSTPRLFQVDNMFTVPIETNTGTAACPTIKQIIICSHLIQNLKKTLYQ